MKVNKSIAKKSDLMKMKKDILTQDRNEDNKLYVKKGAIEMKEHHHKKAAHHMEKAAHHHEKAKHHMEKVKEMKHEKKMKHHKKEKK